MSDTMRKLINFPVGARTTKTATLDHDMPNLAQVQSLIAGNLATKEAVATESDSDFDIATGGLPLMDGYQLQDGDRVLLHAQTDATENGIYIADTGGWSRSADADEQSELAPHTKVSVLYGDHSGRTFKLSNTTAPVVDTDAQDWIVTSASSSAAVDTTVDESSLANVSGANVQALAESIDDEITATRQAAGSSFNRVDTLVGSSGSNLGTFTGGVISDDQTVKAALQQLADATNTAAGKYAEGRYQSGITMLTTGGVVSFDHNLGEVFPSMIEVYEVGSNEKITHTLTIKAVSANRVTVQNDDVNVEVRVVVRS